MRGGSNVIEGNLEGKKGNLVIGSLSGAWHSTGFCEPTIVRMACRPSPAALGLDASLIDRAMCPACIDLKIA